MSKKVTCECGITYRGCDKKRHEASKTHINFFTSQKSNVSGVENNIHDDISIENSSNISDEDNFLDDMNNNKYVGQSDIEQRNKELLEQKKENEKINKENEKNIKSIMKQNKPPIIRKENIYNDDNEDELFSNNATPIYGKEKLQLIKKAQQYKIMFKNELKSFKIKKNANVEELNIAIGEMQNLIETTSTDQFITDSILSSLKIVEGVTANYQNYNISGLSDLLKLNPEFNSLCKQLYLKYGSFNAISPEYKMMFLVFTSAYIVRNKNKSKSAINDFLNQPYENKNIII